MPLYEVDCPKCGRQEIYRRKPESRRSYPCPQCGGVAEKRISVAGFRPFVSYWTEAFSGDDKKSLPVRVDSREQERALCKAHSWERVK